MIAEVRLWGRRIGAVELAEGREVASFQYEPEFVRAGFELSPLVMPLDTRVYSFPELAQKSFHGLPGLLADSLPDKFGNALIDAWLATQGRLPHSFHAVERLCYIGTRGMGALEFHPQLTRGLNRAQELDVAALVKLASEVLSQRQSVRRSLPADGQDAWLHDILQVGTSAGGARAKAVIAWNPTTKEVRSGQVATDKGFEYWLLKLDGVAGNQDKELEDPQGFGAIEYAYALMAHCAGIEMSECRLLEENGRRHFMTRRFDRLEGGAKLHMQSLGALAHFDYNQAGAYAYEQALQVIRRLGLSTATVEQQFRRMVFNIMARNQDDHVKNIAFLMDQQGRWSLSPAFDVTYSYNPSGTWTAQHQMSMNGKRDHFSYADLEACGRAAQLKRSRVGQIVEEVQTALAQWPTCAVQAGLAESVWSKIQSTHRLVFPKT